MGKTEMMAQLLNACGHSVEIKPTLRSNGYYVYYIMRINDKKYTTQSQMEARRDIEKLYSEVIKNVGCKTNK